MSKFNKPAVYTGPTAPIRSTGQIAVNHQGGVGFARDAKSELFLLAVTNMVGESTFYEKGSDRDRRFANLVKRVAVQDPMWMQLMIGWLRNKANMRSAAIAAAVHATRAMLDAKIPGARTIVFCALDRADEPGEMIACWRSLYGQKIPSAMQRGIADAITAPVGDGPAGAAYTEYSMLKYDTPRHAYRFADVLNLCHPDPQTREQQALFKEIIARRYGRSTLEESIGARLYLPMVLANRRLYQHIETDPAQLLNTWRLKEAGMTWEDVSSNARGRLVPKAMWEALIPTMGYMALLRNLRNFDEAGVSDAVAAEVAMRLANPDEVAKSRQLPLRFLSAYSAAPSLRWAYPLEQALGYSLANIPTMTGHTLIMVDASGSMRDTLSDKSKVQRHDAAVLFALSLAQRCTEATIVSFSNAPMTFPVIAGESVLRGADRWKQGGFFQGGGTYTSGCLAQVYREGQHDRVIILTDEQEGASQPWWYPSSGERRQPSEIVAKRTPLYTWNLAGYALGGTPSGADRRFTFGGFSDAAFRMLPLLENFKEGVWPWEQGSDGAPSAVSTTSS